MSWSDPRHRRDGGRHGPDVRRTPRRVGALGSALALLLLPVLVVGACGREERQEQGTEPVSGADGAAETGDDWFVDVAAEAGLDFVHRNGMTGELYFVEPVGSGGGLADLDGDGDLDLILVQGGDLDPSRIGGDPADATAGTRIYRNDLRVGADGSPAVRLVDVTAESGLRALGYGMGVATGDVDGDGRVDLYLTNFGPNQMWRNVSTATAIRFEEVTGAAGVDDPRWSTSAAFADVDGDGDLDLFVANYLRYSLAGHRPCRSLSGRVDYCGPQSYEGETDRLFLNLGDGTFRDVSAASGVLAEPSSGLGVTAADFDDDGRIDLYVANDLRPNVMWRNLGVTDGVPRFEDVALQSGTAVSMLGKAQASMGVVAADFDDDGDEDLFMTHLSEDTNTLYVNHGGVFEDRSAGSGLAGPSLPATGFGVAALDADGDGRLDLAAVNGAVKVIDDQAARGEEFPLRQADQFFLNLGGGRFEERTAQAGAAFLRLGVSRGAAAGDVDNDGRTDLLLTDNHGAARLLLNRSPRKGSWVGLRLLGRPGGSDALGASVRVIRPDGSSTMRRVATDGSYLSARDPRIVVGVERGVEQVDVEVGWPRGGREIWIGVSTGSYHRLVRGEGRQVTENLEERP